MYNPATRLLTILELLQSRGEMSGHELAQALEVEERSIRRYILMLRDMGIPIEGERGPHGGYRLRRGFRLPPLMFNADEITAVMMGLMLTRELGSTALYATESAIAKIDRVLPEELRRRADALQDSLVLNHVQLGVRSVPNTWITTLSLAAYEGKCLDITYRSADGSFTQRVIDPYGLVLHARTYYVPAYCHLREDKRVFRLDRVQAITPSEQGFILPKDFDARAFVMRSLAQLSDMSAFEIMLHAPLGTAQECVSPALALLEDAGENTLMRCYSDNPYWLARILIGIELPFTILKTEELRAALRTLADEILEAVGDPDEG